MAVSELLNGVPVVLVAVIVRRPTAGHRLTPAKFERRDDQKHNENGEKQGDVTQRDSRILLAWWIRLCLSTPIRIAIEPASRTSTESLVPKAFRRRSNFRWSYAASWV